MLVYTMLAVFQVAGNGYFEIQALSIEAALGNC